MNILYMTQSGLLRAFHDLHSALENIQSFDRVGFYVTDSLQFQRYTSEVPHFLEKGFSVTKEWDIVNDARTAQVDFSKLEAIEKRIGKPYLSDALIADRRITFGPHFAEIQNYRPRFNHDEMHIVCPWHGWEYDLETGEMVADRKFRLRKYDVEEREDGVYVLL